MCTCTVFSIFKWKFPKHLLKKMFFAMWFIKNAYAMLNAIKIEDTLKTKKITVSCNGANQREFEAQCIHV